MARCSGPKGPAPATPPFDRSQGVAITAAPLSPARSATRHRRPADLAGSRRPRPPKRATGTFRRPRPLATKGGDARHQLASPPSVAHLAAPLGRHSVVLTLRRCKIWIPLHGIILPAARGDGPRPSALPPGARRSGIAPATREPRLGHSRAKAKSPPDGPAGSPRRRRAVLAPSVRGHCPWPRARARRRSSWPPQCRAA